MSKIESLLTIEPDAYQNEILEEADILEWFEQCDAFWMHSGDPLLPHAELTSGLCSNGFFDCLRVLSFPNLAEILAWQLGQKILNWDRAVVDWVVGSAYAAITFSHEAAKFFEAQHGFVEKDPTDPKSKKMVWKRREIPEGASVLQVEELVTTSGTLKEVRRAITEGNGQPVDFSPIVGALVHRPPKLPADYSEFGVEKVVALVEKEIWAVRPEDCPLCKAGSKRLRPKTNWKELTRKA